MTANGQPDQSRSARYVLKEYVNGKLLYCHAPPGHNQKEFHVYAPRVRRELDEKKLPAQQQRAMRVSVKNFKLKINHVYFSFIFRLTEIKQQQILIKTFSMKHNV